MSDEVPPEVAEAKAAAARARGEQPIPVSSAPLGGVTQTQSKKNFQRAKARRRMQRASRRANRR